MSMVQKQNYSKRLIVKGKIVFHCHTSYLVSFSKGNCCYQFLVYPAYQILCISKNMYKCFLFFKKAEVSILN